MHASEPRSISILGATGSVGTSTLDLVRRSRASYRVQALTAANNVDALAALAIEFAAEFAAIAVEGNYKALKEALAGTRTEVAAGPDAIREAASRSADWVMSAIVGAAGLQPTLEAVRRGATVALANKECLVCAGDLMMQEVRDHGATLLPVDSEHNAIYQVFDFDRPETIDRIILTASGGPFRQTPIEVLENVTPEQAVDHPNWDMGAKISVDSATMMNKGLEMIEAYHLFPVRPDQIDVLVHPQSVIHSMVEYKDRSVLAQLGSPDMRTPIAYALAWPGRMECPSERLSLADIAELTFERPDYIRFPALGLARSAMLAGGAAPVILNAVNEIAVAAFLAKQIGFMDISKLVSEALDQLAYSSPLSIADVVAQDTEARDWTRAQIRR